MTLASVPPGLDSRDDAALAERLTQARARVQAELNKIIVGQEAVIEQALVALCNLSATNRVRDLVPLLDDVTPITYERSLPGPAWRICDRAAVSIAVLLGWESQMLPIYIRPERRDEMMTRVREWAKQSP